jgi:hypothetical protein
MTSSLTTTTIESMATLPLSPGGRKPAPSAFGLAGAAGAALAALVAAGGRGGRGGGALGGGRLGDRFRFLFRREQTATAQGGRAQQDCEEFHFRLIHTGITHGRTLLSQV